MTAHFIDTTQGPAWRAKVEDTEQSLVVQQFAGESIHDPNVSKPKTLKVGSKDVSGAIKLAADRASKPRFFEDGRAGLMFANGFVEVSVAGIKLHAHSPEHRARFGYEFSYDDGAPIKFLKYLDGVFRDDVDKQEKILFLQEFLGILPHRKSDEIPKGRDLYKRRGSDGKSQLLDVFEGVFPSDAGVLDCPSAVRRSSPSRPHGRQANQHRERAT